LHRAFRGHFGEQRLQHAPMSNSPRRLFVNSSQPVRVIVRRDTSAWRAQVWISFGVALAVCATGLAWLPGEGLGRAFLVMGYVFCLSSAFALAKFVRDQQTKRGDTPLWSLVVWGGFGLAMSLTGWGLWRMQINPTYKAYLLVGWLFLISSAFTLAK